MDWSVGDIAVVRAEHDRVANNCLFYLTSISDDIATGYLTTGGWSPEERPYTCPLSQMDRIARVVKWNPTSEKRIPVLGATT